MDQRSGALRIAVFRLNFRLKKGDGGDLPRPDAKDALTSILQSVKQGEDSGLRILTDPDAATEPLLRFRQDQRLGRFSLSDVSDKTATVTQLKAPGALCLKDPK